MRPALMWPGVSSRLTETFAAGGAVVTKLDVLVDGTLVRSFDPAEPTYSDVRGILDGRVDVQRGVLRRTGDITILHVDRAMTQGDTADLLQPLSTELRPWRGAIYHDATSADLPPADRELVPLGTLVVVDVDFDGWPAVRVTCRDRAWFLQRHRFVQPHTVASGTAIEAALVELLTGRVPAGRLEYDFPSTGLTTGAHVWDEQGDPADAAHDLAAAAGGQLYADPMGRFVLRPETDIDTDPIAVSYVEGQGSMLLRPTRRVSGEDAVTAVVVSGEAPDLAAPVRGYAEDTDPQSPTYVGKLGVIPEFFATPLARTEAQANLMAATRGRNVFGLSEATAVTGLVHPGLESGDVLYVSSPSRGIDTKLVADSFAVPLRGREDQTITSRAKVIT